MTNPKFTVLLILILCLCRCKKENTEKTENIPVSTSLEKGPPKNMTNVNAILWTCYNDFKREYKSNGLSFICFFADPGYTMYYLFQRSPEPPTNIKVGQVSMNGSPGSWGTGSQGPYCYNADYRRGLPCPDSVVWKAEGNQTFLPFHITITDPYPEVKDFDSSVVVKFAQGFRYRPASDFGKYDSLTIRISLNGGTRFRKTYSGNLSEVFISPYEIVDIVAFDNYLMEFTASRFHNITINDKVYLFENSSQILKRLDLRD
jgi:hypothetical protein